MKKNTVIFDFDGTLGNTIPYIFKVANQLASDYGFNPLSNDQFNVLRDKSPFEIIHELHIPVLKIPFILHKGKKLLQRYMKEVEYIPGMKNVVKTLKEKGFKVGMLTSNSRENIDVFLEKHAVGVFDFIYTENNLFGKQFSLRKIIKKEHLYINNTIYIGDEVRDVEACQVLGLDIISVTWGFSTRNVLETFKPAYIAEKPEEILEILL